MLKSEKEQILKSSKLRKFRVKQVNGCRSRYPFAKLNVNERFDVKSEDLPFNTGDTSLRVSAYQYSRNHGTKFSVLKNGNKFSVVRVA